MDLGHIEETLNHRIEQFPHDSPTRSSLLDAATVVSLAAGVMQRRLQADDTIIGEEGRATVAWALAGVERDMCWIAAYGQHGDEREVSRWLMAALFDAKLAASIFAADAASSGA